MSSHTGVYLCLMVFLLATAGATVFRQRHDWTRERLVEKFYSGNLRALTALLAEPQMPERHLTGRESFYAKLKANNRVLGFSWDNCGSGSDPIQIKDLELSPDPVQLPGDVEVTFDVIFNTNVTSAFEIDLDVKKKVAFFWVDVPCIDNMGSCTYGDVCSMLPPTCPPSFQDHGVPCTCPFLQGEYALPQTSIHIPDTHMPSFLTTGDYKVTVNGANQGQKLFCIELQLSLD